MRKDKSEKGSFDSAITPLCVIINQNPHFCTTSSCAGRIVLISLDDEFKKTKSIIHFSSHDTITCLEMKSAVASYHGNQPLWLRSEPFILHVNCETEQDAQHLLTVAHTLGLKHSGIISLGEDIVVEITSTEKMDVPMVVNKKCLPSEEYLEIIIAAANARLLRTRKKLNAFSKEFTAFVGLKERLRQRQK